MFDGEQYYYAKETPRKELIDFIEQLNTEQFAKIEEFFKSLPKLNKKIQMNKWIRRYQRQKIEC